ncbi:MAG: endolytic transglycosylase MltG, partial [Enterococcus hulanensis]
MSEDQNQHSEEGSFKEQIMKALEEGRKNREAESVKKATTRPEPSKAKKDTSDDDDLASSYERLFGNRQKKNDTAVSEQKSKPIEK